KNGVATSVVSISIPGIWFGGAQAARTSARKCNEYAAHLVQDHPGRFAFFASAPLPDTEGSLQEIAYALDVLKASGFIFMTNYADKWPGDPAYALVFEELNRLKSCVFPSERGELLPSSDPKRSCQLALYVGTVCRTSISPEAVDLIMLNTDEHVLTNPAVRMASQGGSVDWFRFWLQNYEDPDPAKKEQYIRWRELRKMQQENDAKAKAANEKLAPVN